MEFLEHAKRRFSSRSFLNRPIPKDVLDYILESARVAPSAANRQAYVIYVLTSGEKRELVNNTYSREWIKQAPVLLVVCENTNASWKHSKTHEDYAKVDASIAIDHITLAASEKKIGTCWICHFDIRKCTNILELGHDLVPFALIPMGYTEEIADLERHKTKRKSLMEIIKIVD